MPRGVVCALPGLLAVLAWAGPAMAQEPEAHGYGLSGDWDGARSRLEDAGWTFRIHETLQAGANVSGGDGHATAIAGQLTLGATADMDKLAGIQGGRLKLTLTRRHGNTLADAAGLDLLQPVISIHGRGDIWRLTQLFWEQDLADGRVSLKLGRVNPGSDFAAFSCGFQNLSFCGAQPGNLIGDYWQNWPVSQWGSRVSFQLGDGAGSVSAGAYRVSRANLDDGFASTFDGEGMLYPVEAAWTPALGSAGLPGTYRLTGWYASVAAGDVATGAVRRGRHGASLLLRQQVSGEPDAAGLTLFLRLTQADRRTSRLDRQVTAGAEWHGPSDRRPDDVLAFAVGTTHVNDRAEADTAGAPGRGSEYVAELDYRMKVRKGLSVMPNLQLVHPTGRPGPSDVLALGLKLSLGF